jgi:hypothetical protein
VIGVALAASSWPDRLAPEAAGPAGLALGLVVIALLTVQELRADWREKLPPGPVPARRPVAETESLRLHWAVATVLLLVLAVVVVERIVVLT